MANPTVPQWVRPDWRTRKFDTSGTLPNLDRGAAVLVTVQADLDSIIAEATSSKIGLEFFTTNPTPTGRSDLPQIVSAVKALKSADQDALAAALAPVLENDYAPLDDVTTAVQQYVTSLVVTNTILANLANTTGYVYVLVDSNGKMALGVKPNGHVSIAALDHAPGSVPMAALGSDVPLPQPINSGMAVYAITDQNGALAWWVTQSGAVEFGKLGPKAQALIATLVGGPAKNYQSSYTPTKLPAGVSDTRPVSSGPDFVGVGHSMMAGAGGSGTTIMSVLATLSGRTCRTMAVGGETSEPIIGRQGGNPFLLLPTDGTIHADTSASTVTYDFDGGHDSDQVWVLLQGTGDPGQGSIATGLHGTLAGVPGYLRIVQPSNPGSTHNATDYYTFTRDTAGAAVTVNRPTPFYCDAGLARRNDIPVFWIGRNNISNIARIQADLAAAIEWLAPADKRFLILSEHNNTSEVSGSTNWTNVTTLNRNLRNLYGRRFIDSRKYLIQYGLADAGLTATTQDNTDIANDCVPTQLTADGLHLTGAGYTILANLVNQRATELGWI